tara:strand:+ start:775 stop:918 length:144 start_codon:yes stop_codon:yes gene_type:complete
MSNKQINGEIVKSLIINVNKEKILQNKKKINECFRFIFLVLFSILIK